MVPSSSSKVPQTAIIPNLSTVIWGCIRDYLSPDLPLQEAIAEVSQEAMQAMAEDWNKQLRWQPSLDRVIRWMRPNADPTDRSQEGKVVSIAEVHELKRYLVVAEQLKEDCSRINEVFQAREEGNAELFHFTEESRDGVFFEAAMQFARKAQATSETVTELGGFTEKERIQEWVQKADEIPWFYFVLASVLLKDERELLKFNFSSLTTWQINRVTFLCLLQKNPKIELFKKLLPFTSAYREDALPYIQKFVFTTFLLYAIENKQKEMFQWLLSLQKPCEPNLVLERLAFHNWEEEIPSFVQQREIFRGFSPNMGHQRAFPIRGFHKALLVALDQGNFKAFHTLRNNVPKLEMDIAILLHIRDLYQDPAKYQNRRTGMSLETSSVPDHREKALQVVRDILQKEYSPISEEIQQRISQLIWQGDLQQFERNFQHVLQGEELEIEAPQNGLNHPNEVDAWLADLFGEEAAEMPEVAIPIQPEANVAPLPVAQMPLEIVIPIEPEEEDEAVRASCFSSLKRYVSKLKADPFTLALNVFTITCLAGMAFHAASAYMNREEDLLDAEVNTLRNEWKARYAKYLSNQWKARFAELEAHIANMP